MTLPTSNSPEISLATARAGIGPGSFIISFDCEGKWGLSDHLSPSLCRVLTTDNLASAFAQLISELAVVKLKATFAFVGAYAQSKDSFLDRWAYFDDALQGQWPRSFKLAMARDNLDGWFNPKGLEFAQSAGHEIAAHGFTHRSLGAHVPAQAVQHELRLLNEMPLFQGRDWTLVYPRNELGWMDLLSKFGICGYRGADPRLQTKHGRLLAICREMRGQRSQDKSIAGSNPTEIPAGYFLNWRSGLRTMLPISASLRNWRMVLDHAVITGGVAHLWLHPHNFLTAPATWLTFRGIIEMAAEHVSAGRLQNVTMLEYARAMRMPALGREAAV